MLMRASPFMVAGWGYGVSSGCHYFCKIVGNLLRKSTGLSHPDISHSRRRWWDASSLPSSSSWERL